MLFKPCVNTHHFSLSEGFHVFQREWIWFLVSVHTFPPFTFLVRKWCTGIRNWICNLERTQWGQLSPDDWSPKYWLTVTNDGPCFHQPRNLSVAKILKRLTLFTATGGIQIALWITVCVCSFVYVLTCICIQNTNKNENSPIFPCP